MTRIIGLEQNWWNFVMKEMKGLMRWKLYWMLKMASGVVITYILLMIMLMIHILIYLEKLTNKP
ncbi:hypothetical protein DSY27_09680 [Lactobacillus helveticus]|nr:hypothetical protein DSY27_09680 [Lactobacillus helveticus]